MSRAGALSWVLAVLLNVVALPAQTMRIVPTGGPNGPPVFGLAQDRDGWLYAAAWDGVYRSRDRAQHWERLPLEFENSGINGLAVDSVGVLFVVSKWSQVSISRDRGDTWHPIGDAFLIGRNLAFDASGWPWLGGSNSRGAAVFRLSADSSRWLVDGQLDAPDVDDLSFTPDGTILAASWRACVFYRRSDTAARWTQWCAGLGCREARAVRRLASGVYLCGTDCGLYRAEALGQTWKRVEGLPDNLRVDVILADDDTVFIGSIGSGVLRSSDGGNSWVQSSSGLQNPSIHAILRSRGRTYCGTEQGLHESNDGGLAWRPTNAGLGLVEIRRLAVNQSGDLFATTPYGVFRSTDRGIAWQHTINGMEDHDAHGIWIDDLGRIWTGTRKGVLFRSSDNGDSWSRLSFRHLNRWIEVLRRGPDDAIYMGTSGSDGSIFRSTDDGLTWDSLTTTSVIAMDFDANGHLFVGSDQHGVGIFDIGTEQWTYRGLQGGIIFNVLENAGRYYATCDFLLSGVKYSDRLPDWSSWSISHFYGFGLGLDSAGNLIVGGGRFGELIAPDGRRRSIDGIGWRQVMSVVTSPEGRVYLGLRDGGVWSLDDPSSSPGVEAIAGANDNCVECAASMAARAMTVTVGCPSTTSVDVEVFSLLGRRVATFSGTPASGRLTVMLPDDVMSGGYLVRVLGGKSVCLTTLWLVP